jgi:hypothetical protein
LHRAAINLAASVYHLVLTEGFCEEYPDDCLKPHAEVPVHPAIVGQLSTVPEYVLLSKAILQAVVGKVVQLAGSCLPKTRRMPLWLLLLREAERRFGG